MMGILNRFGVILLVAVFAVAATTANAQELGQVIANTDGGAVGIFLTGNDVVDLCAEPYCNNNANTGTDGQQYNVLLGYSDGAGQNQWLFFNLFGTEGVDVDNGVLADPLGCPLCTERTVGLVGMEWSMDYGPGTMISPAAGEIVALSPGAPLPDGVFVGVVVPEPATGLLSLAGLALLGFIRRR